MSQIIKSFMKLFFPMVVMERAHRNSQIIPRLMHCLVSYAQSSSVAIDVILDLAAYGQNH